MKFLKNFSFEKVKKGLEKTRASLINKISETFSGKTILDDDTLDKLEEILISADIGSTISERFVDSIRKDLSNYPDKSFESIKNSLKKSLKSILNNYSNQTDNDQLNDEKPKIIMIVGVNGTGKTTSIAKLAKLYKSLNYNILITSADKFRAAANEQLETWAKRVEVPVFHSSSSDPSAVVYDSLIKARNSKTDLVIIDTAGRLHNQRNLMDELVKIKRVITKFNNTGPDEIFLVIDGSTGQNGLLQAKEFSKHVNLTGFIITKLDGTAKGGIVFQLVDELKIPVRFIGVGENIDDLMEFDADSFIEALLN